MQGFISFKFAPKFSFFLKKCLFHPNRNFHSSNFHKNEETPKTLKVELIRARELYSKKTWLPWSPFCEFKVGLMERKSSFCQEGDPVNPIWGEVFYFGFNSLGNLEITVKAAYDVLAGWIDDTLGWVHIDMSTIEQEIKKSQEQGSQEWSAWFPLQSPPQDQALFVKGNLYLQFSLVDLTKQDLQKQKYTSAILPHPRPMDSEEHKIKNLKNPWWDFSPDVGPPKRKYRILCLDGGGVRGALSSGILHRLQDRFPDLLNRVDLIAGTSTGGLLALLLASGYTPFQCQDIYKYHSPQIFNSSPTRRYSPFKAKYENKVKYQMLQTYLGDRTLGDLLKYVAIVSFRLDGAAPSKYRETLFSSEKWRPAIFSNIPKAGGRVEADNDLLCIDAGMRTSAAPTYFPVYQGYVDGAVFANNPAFSAISKAMVHLPSVDLSNVTVLSIGAGSWNYKLKEVDSDWGVRQWIPHILPLLQDAQSVAINFHLDHLLGDRYFRVNPLMKRFIPLDAAADVPDLCAIAEEADLSGAIRYIEKHWFDDEDDENK